VVAEQAQVLHQTKVALTGVVAEVAALDMTVDQVAAAVVRVVPDQVHLVVQEAPVVKVIQAVRAVDEVRQAVAEIPLGAQTHALAVRAVVLVSISLAIHL